MARSELEGCKPETLCHSNCFSLAFCLVLNEMPVTVIWPGLQEHTLLLLLASQRVFFFFFFSILYLKCTAHVLLLVRPAMAIWHISFPVSDKPCSWHAGVHNLSFITLRGRRVTWCSFSLCLSLSLFLRKTMTTDRSSETNLLFHPAQLNPLSYLSLAKYSTSSPYFFAVK